MQPEPSHRTDSADVSERAPGDVLGALRERYPLDAVRRRVARRRAARRTLGGAVLCAVLGATVWRVDPAYRVESFQTAVGEHRDWRLVDGTRLVLDTGSAARVEWRLASRRLEIERGAAYVEVAHEALRPLRTQAGPVAIRDIGTAFTVRRDAALTRVSVQSGAVGVALAGQPATELRPGQQVEVNTAVERIEPVQAADDATPAWVGGRLRFDGTPLAAAVAEMQRYRAAPVRVAPDAAALKLSGQFDSARVDTLIALLPHVLPVRIAHEAGGAVSIVHR
ncbi:FecR family protein [Burkholderia sp. Ac-20379]|uniref:FecR family protein n=1 Tax=Burkholderia sp. Ac-20379 TaxID=2703900 RepID=UPI001981514A|nr:FecR domain-containing protein [Burkholderia sp. Ac-20379]MBN3726022.1 iron dicitrate transport regulator FecR [Burkholderia sp. Ac-20379]